MQGIKFDSQNIQAILDGRKTMTRRPLNDEQIFQRVHHVSENECAKYKIGETVEAKSYSEYGYHGHLVTECELKITNIKVERLQDISEEDCVKEGVVIQPCLGHNDPCDNYTAQEIFEVQIWNKLPYEAPYDWNSNPYVFVYEFETVL